MSYPARPLVLLSDPDSDSREVYGTILRFMGAEVIETAEVSDAFIIAAREPISAVVTELLLLPSGVHLHRALSEGTSTRQLPVFVVTSEARPELLMDARKCGTTVVRVKPLTPRDLALLVLGSKAALRN
ncbi:MAG TPA: hypothetical protein VF665_17985 [Longimicrobium sp.]|jgi:DNA-binding NtrC family response regulator|uniref:response regulator n=1 Tax=Longimicrobium sp. TaxID=2029185 RepID=UPI002ED8D4A6